MKKVVLSIAMLLCFCVSVFAQTDIKSQLEGNAATITLTENSTLSAPTTVSRTLTLDLGGKTLTLSGAIVSAAGGDVTIKNGTIEGNGVTDMIEANAGKITLGEGLTINNTSSVIWAHAAGTVTIDGAEITCTSSQYTPIFIEGGSTIDIKGNANIKGSIGSVVVEGAGSIAKIDNAKIESNNTTLNPKIGAELIVDGENTKITTTSTTTSAIVVNDGAKAVINNGEIYGPFNAMNVKTNGSKAEINGGKIHTTNDYIACSWSGGEITLNDGTLISENGSGICANSGTWIINGGEVQAKKVGLVVYENNSAKAIISGGKISGGTYGVACSMGTVEIKNNPASNNPVSTAPEICGNTASVTNKYKNNNSANPSQTEGTITITGGIFCDDVEINNITNANFLADGYTTVQKDGKFQVVAETDLMVSVGDGSTTANFLSLYDAVEYVKTNNIDDPTIKLLKDQESGKVNVTFPATLDLNEKTLTFTENEAFEVSGDGDVTVKNGTIDNTGNQVTDFIYANGGKITFGEGVTAKNTDGAIVFATNSGTFTLTDGAIVESEAGHTTIFGDGGSTIEINNGKVSSKAKVAVAAVGNGSTITVDGEDTEIYSEYINALNAREGAKAVINDGYIHSDSAYVACSFANSEITVNGGKFESGTWGLCANSGTFIINGGEVKAKWAGLMVHESDNAKAVISGGKITSTNYYGVLCTKGNLEIKNDTATAISIPEICGGNGYASVWNEGIANNQENAPTSTGTITITGGIFCDDVENNENLYSNGIYVDENYGTICKADDGTFQVVEKVEVVISAADKQQKVYNAEEQTPDQPIFTAKYADGNNVEAGAVEFVTIMNDNDEPTNEVKGTDADEYTLDLTADMFKRSANACTLNPMKFIVDDNEKTFTFEITKRALVIENNDSVISKVYDGTPLEKAILADADSKPVLKAENLVEGHVLNGTIKTDDFVAGEYTCTQGLNNADPDYTITVSDVKITNAAGEDVTANYSGAFDFTATIAPDTITLTATDKKDYNQKDFASAADQDGVEKDDENGALGYEISDEDLQKLTEHGDEMTVEISGSQVCPGESDNTIASVVIMNTAEDRDVTESYVINKVAGKLTVMMPCEEGLAFGWQCWAKENVEDPAGVYYKEDDENSDFGYLYTWYEAAGVAEGEEPQLKEDVCGEYLQGICPDGWGIPTAEDFKALVEYVGGTDKIKTEDAQFWLPGKAGVDPAEAENDAAAGAGFEDKAAGFYNSNSARYEGILGASYYWTSENSGDSAVSASSTYYCSEILDENAPKKDRRSVRCIRKSAN